MNIVKTKRRATLKNDVLNAIMHIKFGLKRNDDICITCKLPTKVLERISRNEFKKNEDIQVIEAVTSHESSSFEDPDDVVISVGAVNGNEPPNSQTQTKKLKRKMDSSGYNSADEHRGNPTTMKQWQIQDAQFTLSMQELGYKVEIVKGDGACLFRAIALQIYGDEDMHDVVRQNTMDFISYNREHFGQFINENFDNYVKRKRRKISHGNHIEIQAISDMYSRPVEVYRYKRTPYEIFNSLNSNNDNPPLRLAYQRNCHFNAILNPAIHH